MGRTTSGGARAGPVFDRGAHGGWAEDRGLHLPRDTSQGGKRHRHPACTRSRATDISCYHWWGAGSGRERWMAHEGEDRLEGFFAPGEFRLEGQFVPGGESRMRLVPAPYGLSTSGAVFLRRTTAHLGSGAEQDTPSFRMLHPPNTSTHPPDGPSPPLHTPYPPSDPSTSPPGSQHLFGPGGWDGGASRPFCCFDEGGGVGDGRLGRNPDDGGPVGGADSDVRRPPGQSGPGFGAVS